MHIRRQAVPSYEFAHGRSQPIAELHDPVYPSSCSVDRSTGNLAVSGAKGVAIFKGAAGTPTMYSSSSYYFKNCSYYYRGNLYALVSSTSANQALLVRLKSGSSAFGQIQLSVTLEDNNDSPAIQWDGKHLAVSSQIGTRR